MCGLVAASGDLAEREGRRGLEHPAASEATRTSAEQPALNLDDPPPPPPPPQQRHPQRHKAVLNSLLLTSPSMHNLPASGQMNCCKCVSTLPPNFAQDRE